MIEINLIPAVKQELIKVQRIRAMVISVSILVGIGAAVIVTLLLFYVFAVQTVRVNIADEAIKTGAKQLSDVKDLSKTLTLQNQLTLISTMHANKKIDSRIFDVLLAIIPPAPNDVQISDLAIDSSNGTITMQGQAANSYAATEVFRKTIEGAKVKYTNDAGMNEVSLASNVSTGETSYGEDATNAKVLRFTLSFTYAKELFSPLSKNVTIEIATKGNATDSYLGVPKSIFVDRATDLKGAQ